MRLYHGNATLAGIPVTLYSCLFSPSLTLLLGRSPAFVARLTSQTLLPASTGYVHPSDFSLTWRFSSAELFTARRDMPAVVFGPLRSPPAG